MHCELNSLFRENIFEVNNNKNTIRSFILDKHIGYDRIGWFIYTPNMVKKDYPHWCCERTNKTKQ